MPHEFVAEGVFQIFILKLVDVVALVVHRREDDRNFLFDPQRIVDVLERLLQQVNPVHRVVLGLHRDEDFVRHNERVGRHHRKRRRAVDDAVGIVVRDFLKAPLQNKFAADHPRQPRVDRRHQKARRDDVDIVSQVEERVRKGSVSSHQVIDARPVVIRLHQRSRQIRLHIAVDQQEFLVFFGQILREKIAQIDRGRGLAASSF